MAQQTTTGVLSNLALEMIAGFRYTAEHNAPMTGLVTMYTLKKGHDTLVVPKLGQYTLRRLNEGEEIVDEQDLGLTTLSATTSEVGGKITVTKRLVDRIANSAGNTFGAIGRQFGDAYARLQDTDIMDLFSGLNGGTDLGLAGAELSSANAMTLIARAKTDKFGDDLWFVHHPQAIMRLARDLGVVGSGTVRPIPTGFSADILSKVWSGINLVGVPFFHAGNLSRDSSDDARGAIAGKDAMGMLRSVAPYSERGWIRTKRAWEVVFVSDYIAFEHDDSRGAGVLLDAVNQTVA